MCDLSAKLQQSQTLATHHLAHATVRHVEDLHGGLDVLATGHRASRVYVILVPLALPGQVADDSIRINVPEDGIYVSCSWALNLDRPPKLACFVHSVRIVALEQGLLVPDPGAKKHINIVVCAPLGKFCDHSLNLLRLKLASPAEPQNGMLVNP